MNAITLVDVTLIDPHPHNPRRDTGDLTELVDSISAQGIRQNLLVVPNPETPGRFRCIIGHRRLAAAQLAGLPQVPAAIDEELTEVGQRELMLVENLQRVNLSAVEEAQGYQDMLDLGIPVRQIVKATGRSEKTVTGRLKLLTTNPAAQELLHAGQTSIQDVLTLAEFDDQDQEQLAKFLGSRDFDWQVEQTRITIRLRQQRDQTIAAWEARGVTRYPGDNQRPWQVPPGYTDLGAEVDEDIEVPEGTVYKLNHYRIDVYRPLTNEEQAGIAAEDHHIQLETARRKAEEDHTRTEHAAAWATRTGFIKQLLGKKLTRTQENLILQAHLVPTRALAYDAWATLTTENVNDWTGNDTPEAARAFAATLPAHKLMLLVMLYGTNGYWVWQRFAHGEGHDELLRLYRLLVGLGYQLSSVEAAAVAHSETAEAGEVAEAAEEGVGDPETTPESATTFVMAGV